MDRKTISVSYRVLAGNLGDWADRNRVASHFAQFLEETWESELSECAESGFDVQVCVTPEYNTSGCSSGPLISSDDIYVERSVERKLTDSNALWDRWVSKFHHQFE